MSVCLLCGNILQGSSSHFCPGHHIAYRSLWINRWNESEEGSEARADATRRLRQFPGWWNYDTQSPTVPRRGGSTRVARHEERHFEPLTYNFRKFGIELETSSSSEKVLNDAVALVKAQGVKIQNTRYTHDDVPYWKVLTDGSLSGGYCREIVSPAFDTEAGLDEVTTVTSTLATMGVKVNVTCGFHCHLDASDLTAKHIARIVKFYQVYERDIDALHHSSRRGNPTYTGSLSRFSINPDRISSVDELRRILNTRYLKVNVEAYLRHGTIEFRQHGATVDPVKIKNWIKFCTRIVEYAKSDRPINSSTPLFEALNLSEAEKLYWNHRKEVLAA